MVFRPEIEGLRAVAVAAVVAFHAGVPGCGGGFAGVDVFFVLSGYLITGLLLAEREATGGIDLLRFYTRRARRLLPAATLILVLCAVAGRLAAPSFTWGALGQDVAWSGVWAGNWRFAATATDYLSDEEHPSFVRHFWSLGVEEQFYLLWPALLLALSGGGRRRIGLALALAAAGSWGLGAWTLHWNAPLAFFSSATRAWELLAGALLATAGRALPVSAPTRGMLGAVGVGAIALTVGVIDTDTTWPGVATLLPVVGTLLVLHGGDAGRCARLLGLGPLQYLGRLSYSWYLWHWPVLRVVEEQGHTGAAAIAGAVVGSLALAAASHHLVEDPIRRSAALARRPVAVVAGALLLVAASVGTGLALHAWGASLAPRQGFVVEGPGRYRLGTGIVVDLATREVQVPDDRSPDDPALVPMDEYPRLDDPCYRGPGEEPVPCRVGQGRGDRRLVVYGDSHAAQHVPAAALIAHHLGASLEAYVKPTCPPIDLVAWNHWTKAPNTTCRRWQEAVLEALRRMPPAVVLMSARSGHFRLPGADGPRTPQDSAPELEAAILRQVRQLRDVGHRVVWIRDTPVPGVNVPNCMRPETRTCTRRSFALSRSDGELVAALSTERVPVVDLVPAICDGPRCPFEAQGIIRYRDTDHLSATFDAILAPELLDVVVATSGWDPP